MVYNCVIFVILNLKINKKVATKKKKKHLYRCVLIASIGQYEKDF